VSKDKRYGVQEYCIGLKKQPYRMVWALEHYQESRNCSFRLVGPVDKKAKYVMTMNNIQNNGGLKALSSGCKLKRDLLGKCLRLCSTYNNVNGESRLELYICWAACSTTKSLHECFPVPASKYSFKAAILSGWCPVVLVWYTTPMLENLPHVHFRWLRLEVTPFKVDIPMLLIICCII
jgi:hypothetical protein